MPSSPIAWIMARTAKIPERDDQSLVAMLASQGYDPARIRKVPQQRWQP